MLCALKVLVANERAYCRAWKQCEFQLAQVWTILWCCPGQVLVRVWKKLIEQWIPGKLADNMPGPLPIGQVRMESYLASRKIFLSQMTGWHFFEPWHCQGKISSYIKLNFIVLYCSHLEVLILIVSLDLESLRKLIQEDRFVKVKSLPTCAIHLNCY